MRRRWRYGPFFALFALVWAAIVVFRWRRIALKSLAPGLP